MSFLLPLDDDADRAEVGGKGANLARLRRLGFNVPPARALPVAAFRSHLAACRGARTTSPAELRAAIVATPLAAALETELQAFAESVGGRVSVRSSANLEDAHSHAFAGQFLTLLNVGPDGVADAVRRVWASTFTDNVHAYLERAGLAAAKLEMAVVIQQQLDSQASGVVLGDHTRARIEAVFGQGEAVVSAELASDCWDIENGRVVASRTASKSWRVGLPPGPPKGSLARIELPEAMRTEPSLTASQVMAVAELAGRLAQAFDGRAQDGEFAFTGSVLHVLQSRDVTAALPVEAAPLGPWTAPGKGAWQLDDSHFVRPLTRLFAELFPAAMVRGFQHSTARYGALLSHMDLALINGFLYSRLRPVAAPEDATTRKAPPAFLFRLLCRLHPELRRRLATANRIWESREWRRQAEEWQQDKVASIAAHLELQGVDRAALDDAALIAHLRAVAGHVERMIEQHHRYNLAGLVPAGDLLAQALRWSEGKLSPMELLELLSGSSPISADLRSPDAVRLARAVAGSAAARALLALEGTEASASAAPGEVAAARALLELRRLDGEIGASVRHFLDHREYRLSEGLDPAAPCFRELPALLWRALRDAARNAEQSLADPERERERLRHCREAIPPAHREAFDSLLAEARAAYHLRDERALYSDVWAWGILRTVCLEIGARLLQRGPAPIVEAGDVLQAGIDELEALLLRGQGPSALELRRRGAFQSTYSVADAPGLIGPAPLPPPGSDLLPAGSARLNDAVMTIMVTLTAHRGQAPVAGSLELPGRPASGGVYEGPVHILDSPRDVETLKPGSVLVVGASSSAFTMLAPLAAAVVAEGGGLLSHVAIVCREYRIPCVCGCTGVLERLRSGDRVRVDGTRGTVTLLERRDPA